MRDELSLLEAQLTYKKRLEAMADELRAQRAVLQQKVTMLEQKMILEKKDVERLEGKSLAAFYYHAFGKIDEKLEGERREYYAARVKYDAAVRELKAVELDLECTEEDLQDLQDCEQRYARAMEEKRRAIKDSGTEQSREFLEKEQDLNFLKSQERELQEAIAAGTAALRVANDMVLSLKHVEGLGLIDRLGSTFLTDMAKREVLDDAQKNVEQLQIQLQKVGIELKYAPAGSSPENTYLYHSRFDMTLQGITFSLGTVDIMMNSHFVNLNKSSNYGRLVNDELAAKGVTLIDTPQGTTYKIN